VRAIDGVSALNRNKEKSEEKKRGINREETAEDGKTKDC